MSWYNIQNKGENVLNIDINDEIGGWGITSRDFIDYVQNSGKTKINLVIDSPGGSVFDAFAIYDFLTTSKKYKVSVHVRGLAASAASVLALAGDTLPTMTENSFIMIHNPYLTKMDMDFYTAEKLEKKAEEMINEAELLKVITDKIANIYVSKTGADKEEILMMMEKETWIDSNKALEMGFVSSVTESVKIAAKLDGSKMENLGIKAAPKQFVINNNLNKMKEVSEQIAELKDFVSNLFKSNKEEEKVQEVKILDSVEVQNKIAEINAALELKESEIANHIASINAKDSEIEALKDELAKAKGLEVKPEVRIDAEPTEGSKPDEKEAFGKSILANLIANRYEK